MKELIKRLGISKVKLAKYLGVSRQMVYNYLELNSIAEWPADKKNKLLFLFNINRVEELKDFNPSNETIARIDKLLRTANDKDDNYILNTLDGNYKLDKKSQKVLSDIISILKEKLSEDDNNNTQYNICKYLLTYLQIMDDVPELKYVLAYFSKANGYVDVNEFAFDNENQVLFEGILYQAITLFNNKGFSKSRVIETHKKFEAEIAQKHEEKLSRTQELNTVKIQALKELGYTEINEKNVTEVFEKIAEIQSRKI